MASPAFDVSCPVCRARLTISPEAKSVVAHAAAPPPKPVETLDQAVKGLSKESDRRRELFKGSLDSERSKTDRLRKSFDDLLQRTREHPDEPPPVRDMDLD